MAEFIGKETYVPVATSDFEMTREWKPDMNSKLITASPQNYPYFKEKISRYNCRHVTYKPVFVSCIQGGLLLSTTPFCTRVPGLKSVLHDSVAIKNIL